MIRWSIPLGVLVAVFAGCEQKKSGTLSGNSSENGDPNATYTITYRDPQVGEKYQFLRSGNSLYTTRKTMKGQLKTDEARGSWRYEYNEEILEIENPNEQPTKARQTYTQAERVLNGLAIPAAFQNKSVLIERIGPSYHFRIEGGGRLAGDDLKYLANQYNTKPRKRPQDLIPNRPVKVGESWKIDKSALQRHFRDESVVVDDARTTGTGQLTKAYKKDGKQYGVVELHIEVFPLEINERGRRMKLKSDSRFVYELRADTCIDGSTFDADVRTHRVGQITVLQPAEIISVDETDTVVGKFIS